MYGSKLKTQCICSYLHCVSSVNLKFIHQTTIWLSKYVWLWNRHVNCAIPTGQTDWLAGALTSTVIITRRTPSGAPRCHVVISRRACVVNRLISANHNIRRRPSSDYIDTTECSLVPAGATTIRSINSRATQRQVTGLDTTTSPSSDCAVAASPSG